jgi:PAS domain S-box-containing protein
VSEPPPGRLVGSAVVGSLGVLLAIGWYVLVGSGRWRSLATVAPFGLAALSVVAAAWLYRSDLDGRIALRVPLLTAVGMGVFGAFATLLTVELLPGPATRRTILLALNFVSAGGAAGVVVGLFTASRAATIRTLRDREAALRHSRDEYRDLFDGVGDAVIVHDTRGRILAANDTARERLGSDGETLVGLPIADVEAGGDAAERRTAGERIVYETAHVAADGDRVPVEVSATLVGYDGRPAVLSVARDVSRRRASERELARTRDQLQALNRVLRHDIRNDMQIVLGLATLLEDHVDAEGLDRLRTIVATGEHVVELTRSSRDLARTVAGESELPLEPTPLGEALTAELDRRREAFDHATIRLEGDLPGVQVRANDLLPSVFRNLLNNAVQHSDRDEPTVVVSADFVRGDHRVRVRIADDGPGIPDDRKGAVFGKGEQTFDGEGAGLGLYLVQSLVDHYGGRVWIEDNEPRGTAVVVELPIEEEAGGTAVDGG